jgi:hypothetical protein
MSTVYERACEVINKDYAILSSQAKNRLKALVDNAMSDAFERGKLAGGTAIREVFLVIGEGLGIQKVFGDEKAAIIDAVDRNEANTGGSFGVESWTVTPGGGQ